MTPLPLLADPLTEGSSACGPEPDGESQTAAAQPPAVKLKNYDWVILNSSGGKDSQTLIRRMVRVASEQGYPLSRLVVVHCDLGSRVEWDGTRELAEEQARHYGLRFEVVSRPQGDILDEVRQRHETIKRKAAEKGVEPTASPMPSSTNRWCTSHHKTNQVSKVMTALVEEVKLASPWPSSEARWCTSDQKRGQVARVMTALADEAEPKAKRKRGEPKAKRKRGEPKAKRRRVRILNCMGMRAAESPARSKLRSFKLDRTQTNGRRAVHTYLPLFDWTAEQVWADIKASGVRHHHAYDLGMGRLSCCFCIYAPKAALLLAGKHNRAKLDEYVKVEQEVGSRFRVELSLAEVRDALDRGEEPGVVTSWEMP
jgi:3'-phosphoadenosine 5'-phosphosulfate sulfotransferase (PAPS reductase)/FAD synthetase